MPTPREILADLKERATKTSIFTILLVLYATPADNQGRLEWWGRLFHKISPYLFSTTGKISIFVLGLLVIYADQRRVTARIGKPHPKSLQGRCLKVRDEMQKTLDSLGPEDRESREDETTEQWIIRTCRETSRRWTLLGHHYELHCASEVTKIFHEFGILGVQENGLDWQYPNTGNRPPWEKKEEEYKAIIDALTAVAEKPKAKVRL